MSQRGLPTFTNATWFTEILKGWVPHHYQTLVAHQRLQPNVMVDADSRPRITDFGLALNQDPAEQRNSTTGGTARWTAPEILKGEGRPSKKADVFSFAMVMVEVGFG